MANLHDFFGGKDTTLPGHFVLRWLDGSPRAEFCRKPPGPGVIRLDRTITWHNKCIRLYTDTLLDPVLVDPPPPKPVVSLLKSHLQKCIRRCHVGLAVRTASMLWDMDLVALLRRIPIIMIEDAKLHTALPVIVWLMAVVDDHHRPTMAMRAWVLGVVSTLASMTTRELVPAHHDEPPPRLHPTQVVRRVVETLGEDGEGAQLVFAMMMRHAYGGMRGDMHMLVVCADRAMEKFSRGERAACEDVPNMAPVQRPLKAYECELAAVDFHVCQVTKHLASHTRHGEASIREAMWHCSSGVTTKTPVNETPTENMLAVWADCIRLHRKWAQDYVKQLL